MKTNRDDLVMQVLVFLSGRPENMERFFAISGLAPADLRARLNEVSFQDGLLDYLMGNEPLLLAFCEEAGEDPAFVARVAQAGRTGASGDSPDSWNSWDSWD